MSLLLDALKKAAQEKLNNGNGEENVEVSLEQVEEVDLSLVASDSTKIEIPDNSLFQNSSETQVEHHDSLDQLAKTGIGADDFTESVNNTELTNTAFQAERKNSESLELEPIVEEAEDESAIDLTDIEEQALDIESEPRRVSTTQLDRFLSDDTAGYKNRTESSKFADERNDITAAKSARLSNSDSLAQNHHAARHDYFSGSPKQAAQVFGVKAKSNKDIRLYILIGLVVVGMVIVVGMFAYGFISQINESTMMAQSTRTRESARNIELMPNNEKIDATLLVEQEDYSDILRDSLTSYDKEIVSSKDNKKNIQEKPIKNMAPTTQPTVAGRSGQYSINRQQKIKREELQIILMRGYQAYNKGDIDTAAVAYKQGLTRSPRSRDALLGMAAVNMIRGETNEARLYYHRLLSLDPKDDVALAGLTGLNKQQNQITTNADELSRIKSMLAEKKDSHYLHFALGNFYAGQKRWPEAQRAYFNAYHLAADNPNYAFNLAVSLEHIGQRSVAMQFYQEALDLADNGQARFAVEAVNSRIQTLGK